MSKIKTINGAELLDSRGNPTVYAKVTLDDGSYGEAIVPSGASTGSKEALELRDNDTKRYFGKGVLTAVSNINNIISPVLSGLDIFDQQLIDNKMIELDGTHNKNTLGANSILSVSMAASRAAAMSSKKPLYEYINSIFSDDKKISMPIPMMNFVNGGEHADNILDIQEFMIQPSGFDTFSQALQAGAEIFHTLKLRLKSMKLPTAVGDEGGFAPDLPGTEATINEIIEAISKAGYLPGKQVFIALDCASSEFYSGNIYNLKGENKKLSSAEMTEFLSQLSEKFPISSIEDGKDENDLEGWKNLTKSIGNKVQLVGDDLFVTNPKVFAQGISDNIANAILIKLNQIGTLSETLECISMAKKNGYNAIISHRSGESSDTFIADLAVGTNAGQIKTGSLSRSDRVEKYNRLLLIEQELLGKVPYGKI